MGSLRLTEETIDAICAKVVEGLTFGAIGEAVGMTRNAVTGVVFRLRQRGDPRIPAAGPRIIVTAAEQRDALADAFADGAGNLIEAAGVANMTPATAELRWSEICATLGRQAS